ncbi:MAG: sugar phosphate isomerase/epimerase [Actinobacteria bacterium]|nr:sugar phosphate isomerase/epimerase [Actinomycetota bacterium]
MKLALSEISTVSATFEEDVAAYAAAGFDGIGIWELKLPADDPANVALLREAGLAVANCVPTAPSILPLLLPGMEGSPDPEERIADLCASVRRFAAYEPESVLCLTGAVGDLEPAHAREIVVAGLREVAAVAREVGVRFGLEPAGSSVSFVATVAETLELLEEAGLDDVGVMADTYNLWDEAPEALAAAAGRISGLHVADVPPEVGREDRLLPGESGTRSAEHVRALGEAGWDGFLDVEIFSTPEGFWGLPAAEAARRALAAVSRLLP